MSVSCDLGSIINRPGKLNNHLEAAIHEAMSELDKMSATVSIPGFFSLLSFAAAANALPSGLRPDPIPGSSGEAPQAQEKEDLQITVSLLPSETSSVRARRDRSSHRCYPPTLSGTSSPSDVDFTSDHRRCWEFQSPIQFQL